MALFLSIHGRKYLSDYEQIWKVNNSNLKLDSKFRLELFSIFLNLLLQKVLNRLSLKILEDLINFLTYVYFSL